LNPCEDKGTAIKSQDAKIELYITLSELQIRVENDLHRNGLGTDIKSNSYFHDN